MNKIVKSKAKIRFQDCDPHNHLNNAQYIDYFMNAREDQLIEHFDFDIFKIAKEEALGWVVGSNQIAYFKPAVTMENVIIESQLIAFSPKSLLVELRMLNETETELKAFLWTNFIHIDLKTKKSNLHQERFMAFLEQTYLPINEKTFEERQSFFLGELKKAANQVADK